MPLIGVYPGSFDPVTNGHLDVIKRASKLVDNLIVGVLNNPSKKCLFTAQERVKQLEYVTQGIPNVKIEEFQGLLVDFVKVKEAKMIIRGLRAAPDFEYEFQMALANKSLLPEAETVFLATSIQLSFISSSMIKEIASFGGNIDGMVPSYIAQQMKEKYK